MVEEENYLLHANELGKPKKVQVLPNGWDKKRGEVTKENKAELTVALSNERWREKAKSFPDSAKVAVLVN